MLVVHVHSYHAQAYSLQGQGEAQAEATETDHATVKLGVRGNHSPPQEAVTWESRRLSDMMVHVCERHELRDRCDSHAQVRWGVEDFHTHFQRLSQWTSLKLLDIFIFNTRDGRLSRSTIENFNLKLNFKMSIVNVNIDEYSERGSKENKEFRGQKSYQQHRTNLVLPTSSMTLTSVDVHHRATTRLATTTACCVVCVMTIYYQTKWQQSCRVVYHQWSDHQSRRRNFVQVVRTT